MEAGCDDDGERELDLVELERPRAGHAHLLGVRPQLPAASRSSAAFLPVGVQGGLAELAPAGPLPAGPAPDPVGGRLAALVEVGHGHHPYSPSRAAGGSCQMAADVA
jgi:hypothetical protein